MHISKQVKNFEISKKRKEEKSIQFVIRKGKKSMVLRTPRRRRKLQQRETPSIVAFDEDEVTNAWLDPWMLSTIGISIYRWLVDGETES